MSSAYRDALGSLLALAPRGVDLGLARVHAALSLRGDPHLAVRAVHVAGTNGKGSVVALLDTMARAAGLRTGRYTSPHLHRFGERITVDGIPIGDDDTIRGVERLLATPGLPPLTFFEAVTVLAFEHFATAGCELVVLETGLGGRLDATNVAPKELAIVTNVGLDHQAYLGTTHAAIAAEKAGIVATGRPLVHGVREPSAREVVDSVARARGAEVFSLGREIHVREHGETIDVRCGDHEVDAVPVLLAGTHQRDNLALAVAAARLLRDRGVHVPDDAIRRGAADVAWPCRLERIEGAPAFLLDGAHNVDGARALRAHLAATPRTRRALVFGGMVDKDLAPMLSELANEVDERHYASAGLPRSASPGSLSDLAPGSAHADVDAAVDAARRAVGPDGLVVVAGSLFVVARVRARLLGIDEDPAIAM